MRALIGVFCLLAVTACSESPTSPSPIAGEVILAPGQTAAVREAGIGLRFQGVSGDSRCPADAYCVWGGDALVQIEILPSSGPAEAHVLHTGDMRPVSHKNLTISLVELSPYPFSARTIEQHEYRATLRVTR
jgi:hypothetical protein